jgi:hypothetical protein
MKVRVLNPEEFYSILWSITKTISNPLSAFSDSSTTVYVSEQQNIPCHLATSSEKTRVQKFLLIKYAEDTGLYT